MVCRAEPGTRRPAPRPSWQRSTSIAAEVEALALGEHPQQRARRGRDERKRKAEQEGIA